MTLSPLWLAINIESLTLRFTSSVWLPNNLVILSPIFAFAYLVIFILSVWNTLSVFSVKWSLLFLQPFLLCYMHALTSEISYDCPLLRPAASRCKAWHLSKVYHIYKETFTNERSVIYHRPRHLLQRTAMMLSKVWLTGKSKSYTKEQLRSSKRIFWYVLYSGESGGSQEIATYESCIKLYVLSQNLICSMTSLIYSTPASW